MRVAALGLAGVLWSATAEADEYSAANHKLADLEERVRVMAAEFRDAPPPDVNIADRRVLDAELLFNLKNYVEAATICLDVIERYPNSRAYDDAIVLLGESLYKSRDLNSARRYFQQAVQKNTGSRKEQSALQRLVEIALRTGDYENVETYLDRLEKISPENLEPSVPYVRGKYLYFRDKPDEALAIFNTIPATNPYYLQTRYFMATVYVKKGDLAAGASGFDAVLRVQPRSDADKEIQDLARMAIGRVHYERGQFDKAKDAYAQVPRQSKHFADAMYEATWNSIKAKDFVAAYRALDLMLLQNQDSPQGPELRLLKGNLHLRLTNFYLASETFSGTRDEFEPIYRQLLVNQQKAQADARYFETLIGQGMEKFDIALFVPAVAVKWVKAEPDVARMLGLVDDVGELQRDIKDSEQTLSRLERAVGGAGKVGIFPDLAMSRIKSTEVLNQTMDLRRKFLTKIRNLLVGSISAEDRSALDQIVGERIALEQQLQNLPLTADKMRDREKGAKGQLQSLDGRASELNVTIQGMEAELTAIEQFYINSRGDQKIRPEDLKQPVADLRALILFVRTQLDKVRNDIADAVREMSAAGAASASERTATMRLSALMKREHEIFTRARLRLSGSQQADFDSISAVLSRADSIQARLLEFDGRVDAVADKRLVVIKERLVSEKTQLAAITGKLSGVLTESQSVGGGLAQAMLGKVTERFYDLVVQSDVGLVDVSWGLKDHTTKKLSQAVNQQKLELKAVEDDFRSLLEETR